MPPPETLVLFVAASVVLLITPGPAVLYIVARSVDQGRLAGIVSVLGITAGTMVHVLAAALGLSAILMSSSLLFSLVKYAGAAYLIYLGVRKLMAREQTVEGEAPPPASLRTIFRDGVIVNLLNPKTALFFFAFLPQFVDPGAGSSVALQIAFLGCFFAVMGMVSDGAWAIGSDMAASWLKRSRFFPRLQRYGSGTIYIGMGLAAALSDTHRK